MSWPYRISDIAHWVGAAGPGTDGFAQAVSTDTRTLKPGDVFFALKGEQFDATAFVPQALAQGAAAVVTTAEAAGDLRILTVEDPLAALQRFAAQHRNQFDIPVFAITGSAGKTTTKDLIAALLATRFKVLKTKGNLNNEIGCPLTLLQLDDSIEFAVIEMGANHVGEIANLCSLARPTESAITLVAPAHLEGFGSIERVAQAKAEIAEGLGPEGRFYVNVDNPWTCAIGERHLGPCTRWGSHGDVVLESCTLDADGEMLLDIRPLGRLKLPLAVPAHAANVTLAVAVGLAHGITEFEPALRAACASAARFKISQLGPLEILDDTYNANPVSMAAALEALSMRPGNGKRFAALGEMLEMGESAAEAHRELGTLAGKYGVNYLFARGPHACDIISAARASGVAHAEVLDSHAAIAQAIHQSAQPGDVLLLKGSRGMRMERVLEALRECVFPSPAGSS
jgi:UDP-N-acetylmuramoyl-tripeptide--D-alanyl-D-alanine ligase